MNPVRVAIIGGGFSGLSFLHGLSKEIKTQQGFINKRNIEAVLFEKNDYFGGRAMSFPIQANKGMIYVDLGANLIDFEQPVSKTEVFDYLGENIANKFLHFKDKFMIYESGKLKNPDYEKQRFYYKGGFAQLASDLISQIRNSASQQVKYEIKLGTAAESIYAQMGKHGVEWNVDFYSKNQEKQLLTERFDYICASCPLPQLEGVFKFSKQATYPLPILSAYTTQITVAYRVRKSPGYIGCSFILFKDHPITFIASQHQKFPENQQFFICVQTNDKFSKENFECDEEKISNKVYDQLIPEQIKKILEIQRKYYKVQKWNPSLVIPDQMKKQMQMDQPKILMAENVHKVYLMGDANYCKSRITNAISSGYRAAYRLLFSLNT